MASSTTDTHDYVEPYWDKHQPEITTISGTRSGKGDLRTKTTHEGTTSARNEISRSCVYCAVLISVLALLVSVCIVVLVSTNNKETSTESSANREDGPTIPAKTVTETVAPSSPPACSCSGGAVYVRWGRTTCPSSSSLVYKGIAGGKWFENPGSGSNYLCLPETPEYDDYNPGVDGERAYAYSAEYQTNLFPGPISSTYQHDVPCAVCRATDRGSMVMIPAKISCPSSWNREYYGYLMSNRYNWVANITPTEFVCVDRNPEIRPGTHANVNGALFYFVEGRCDGGSLPCSPYINGAELTCVVCTRK